MSGVRVVTSKIASFSSLIITHLKVQLHDQLAYKLENMTDVWYMKLCVL